MGSLSCKMKSERLDDLISLAIAEPLLTMTLNVMMLQNSQRDRISK